MATNKKKQKNVENTDVKSKEEELFKVLEAVKIDIKKVKLIELQEYEKELADLLVELAFKHCESNSSLLGYSLAAAFDLLVAAEYYKNVKSDEWLYCPNPNDSPLLIYHYTNTCPCCILNSEFHFHQGKKPPSDTIGRVTQKLLGVFLTCLFKRNKRALKVWWDAQQIDLVVWDEQNNIVLIGEVKAAPLTTLALAVPCEIQTAQNNEGEVVKLPHKDHDNLFLDKSEFHLLLPQIEESKWKPELISLGVKDSQPIEEWFYRQLSRVFNEDKQLFGRYFQFWEKAFSAYSNDEGKRIRGSARDSVYWLTNACGKPVPRPDNWPKTRGGKGKEYESVSDNKTSVGMDRTDDIKKGIYQVLKLRASAKKVKSKITVKTALLSNIDSVRHYDDYLKDILDIVWTTISDKEEITKASELPPEQDMYNLCDGIISFTKNYARDEWIKENFRF